VKGPDGWNAEGKKNAHFGTNMNSNNPSAESNLHCSRKKMKTSYPLASVSTIKMKSMFAYPMPVFVDA
jgi:hypothetical protein